MIRNKEFYSQTPIPKKEAFKPEIDRSNWWMYVVGNMLITLIGPFLNKYKRVLSEEEMIRLWIISAVIVIVINGIVFWFLLALPYLEKRGGYYLVGKFQIVKKRTNSLGHKYLNLDPGKYHQIKVTNSFYNKVHEGDVIILERTRIGNIRKICRMTTIRDRLKRMPQLK